MSNLHNMQVVLCVTELLQLTSPPVQLGDFQLQLFDEPCRSLLRCSLLPLDHSHQLGSDFLHAAEQSWENLRAFFYVSRWVLLEVMNKNKESNKAKRLETTMLVKDGISPPKNNGFII